MRLEGRVAIVTGGAGTIGSAIVRRLAREGAIAVVADLRADAAEAVAAEVEGARAAELDVTDPQAWAALVADLEAEHGAHRHPRQQRGHPRAGAGRGHERRGLGPRHPHQRLLRLLRLPRRRAGDAPGGRGSIVNVVTGQFGVAYSSAYTSSKFLVHGMSQCLVLEVARYGIRVNCIAPGAIPDTGFERWYREKAALLGIPYDEFLAGALDSVPLHRFGRGEDIAEGVLYLASDEADYVTGHLLEVDGGFAGYAFALRPEEG